MDGTYVTDVESKEQVHFGRGGVVVEDSGDGAAVWTFRTARVDDAWWRPATCGMLAWLNERRASGSCLEIISCALPDRGYGRVLFAKEMNGASGDISLAIRFRIYSVGDRTKEPGVALGLHAGFEPDGVWRPYREDMGNVHLI